VIRGVARALKPGGRFVAEMGGHGCVAAITLALVVALERHGVANAAAQIPWYFPTVDDDRGRLERAGFEADYIALIPRPTPLPTDMGGWIETFGDSLLSLLPADQRSRARNEAVAMLRPVLCDEQGRWTGDYIRLRFAAHLK
jgi:SAM-dependent methyltransferase